MDNREILLDLGFVPAGQWILDNGRPFPHLLSGRSNRSALYAFVLSGEVVFIGRLKGAFGGQIGAEGPMGMTHHHATDNDRRIISTLMTGEDIEILEFAPDEAIEYRGWGVNIGAGILDALVERIKPDWNLNSGLPPKSTRPF
ncbi:MAG TPA: hypothetical protein VGM51_11695 [Armatimonadota bacterium]|jgi:hypothetical protein